MGQARLQPSKAISGLLKPETARSRTDRSSMKERSFRNQSPENDHPIRNHTGVGRSSAVKYLTIEGEAFGRHRHPMGEPYRQDLEKVYHSLFPLYGKGEGAWPGYCKRRRTPDAGNGPCPDGNILTCSLLDEPSLGLAPLVVLEIFPDHPAGSTAEEGTTHRSRRTECQDGPSDRSLRLCYGKRKDRDGGGSG